MNPVRADFCRQFHIIIQNEFHPVTMAKFQQFFCLLLHIRFRKFLLTQLYQSGATFQCFLYLLI